MPLATVGARDLRIGYRIRVDGIVSGEVVNADLIALPGEASYIRDPMYQAVPYGSSGWMSGVVQRVDRHLGYLVIRDDATRINTRIDVRHMDLRRPVNVWGIRAGDHISVLGSWERRDLFDARRIEY